MLEELFQGFVSSVQQRVAELAARAHSGNALASQRVGGVSHAEVTRRVEAAEMACRLLEERVSEAERELGLLPPGTEAAGPVRSVAPRAEKTELRTPRTTVPIATAPLRSPVREGKTCPTPRAAKPAQENARPKTPGPETRPKTVPTKTPRGRRERGWTFTRLTDAEVSAVPQY